MERIDRDTENNYLIQIDLSGFQISIPFFTFSAVMEKIDRDTGNNCLIQIDLRKIQLRKCFMIAFFRCERSTNLLPAICRLYSRDHLPVQENSDTY
jgi:hypothetical protein